MRKIGGALFNSLKKTGASLCKCWLLTLTDGTKIGFTDHDRSIVMDGVTYEPTNSFSASAIASADNFSVDNLSVQAITSELIDEQLLRSGGYDNAKIEVFMLDWNNIPAGRIALRGGYLGEVNIRQAGFEAELRTSGQLLQQTVGRVCTIDCDVRELGNSLCGVPVQPVAWTAHTLAKVRVSGDAKKGTTIAPTTYNGFNYICTTQGITGATEPVWPTVIGATIGDGTAVWTCIRAWKRFGSLTAIYSKSHVEDSTRDEPEGWYAYGKIKFLTGANAGVTTSVRAFKGTPRAITFLEPLPFHPSPGDTYEVFKGCDRTWETCKNAFNNIHNHRGHPHMPTETQAMQTPDYKE